MRQFKMIKAGQITNHIMIMGLLLSMFPALAQTVGIGSTQFVPSAMLEIRSTGNTSATFGFKLLNSSSSPMMFIQNDGNVGINTASPAMKLHVVGDGTNTAAFMSGNVGIGTTSPADKLEIVGGAIRLGNSTYSNGTLETARIFIDASSTIAGFGDDAFVFEKSDGNQADPDSPFGFVTVGNDGVKRPRLVIIGTGNVGIGTAAPSSKLQLYDATANTYLTITAPLAFNSAVSYGDITNGEDIRAYRPATTRDYRLWTATAGDAVTLLQNGNVGIGITAPAEALSVFKPMAAAWQSRFSNNSGTGADVYLSHGSGYGMHIRGWNATDAVYTLEMYNNTVRTNAFYNSGRVTLGLVGNVGVNMVTPAMKLHVVGDGTNTATFMSGNVGINTTSPAMKLHVVGNGVNTATFMSGKVGIETTSPTYSLSFGGDAARTIWMERHTVANSSGNNLTIQAGGASSAATDKNGGNLILQSATSTGTGTSQIQFWTAPGAVSGTADNITTQKMVITGAGSVGIGTTSPNAKLEVTSAGIFKGATDGTPDAGELVYDQAGNYYKYYNGTAWISIPTGSISYTGTLWSQNGTNVYYNTGNVGVGTSTPTSKLEVTGNIFNSNPSAGDLGLSGDLPGFAPGTYPTLKSSANKIYISTGGYNVGYFGNGGVLSLNTTIMDNNVQINASGTSWLNGGNVGIGTTTPSEKLHVVGNTRVSAEVYSGGWFRNDNSGTGLYNTATGAGIYSPSAGLMSTYNGAAFSIGGVSTASGNLRFTAANPYITASSYIIIPGGAYFNSGTVYTTAQLQARGGIHNDTGPYLTLAGGTSNITYFSGNVGIGVTAPASPLVVTGTASHSTPMVNVQGNGDLLLNTEGSLFFDNNYNYATGSYIGPYSATSGAYNANNIKFTTAGTERMRIGSTGNIGIGCTSAQYKLHVVGDIAAEGGTLFANSATVNTTVTACSDIRFKKNIVPLTNSLQNVLSLKGISYEWKVSEFPDRNFTNDMQIGFIAQEVEKIYPQLVATDSQGYKSVDYSRLTPVLVEAFKEQQAIMDKLQLEMEKNSTDILELKSEINTIKLADTKLHETTSLRK